jgi:hypothetical protein
VRRPSDEEAFKVLLKIVLERRLLGGTGFVRGSHRCVCFTEAPLDSITEMVRRHDSASLRFKPFGVVVPKVWLFERGGRPVIYQPDSDYALLPPELQYRHVRYEPTAAPPIDLTWEREWRIRTDQLDLDPQSASIVVLEDEHADRLRQAFNALQDAEIARLSPSLGPIHAEQHREPFSWNVIVLGSIDPADVAQYYADRGYLHR